VEEFLRFAEPNVVVIQETVQNFDCGVKKRKVRGELRKLHIEEPCDLYCSPMLGLSIKES